VNRVALGLACASLVGCAGASPVAPAAPAAPAAPTGAAKVQSAEEALLARIDAMNEGAGVRPRVAPGARRPRVKPVTFRVADLPLAKMPEIPRPEDATPVPGQQPKPPPKNAAVADDVQVEPNDTAAPPTDRTVKLTLRDRSPGNPGVGQIALWDHVRRGRNGGGGAMVYERCGPGYSSSRYTDVRWDRFRIAPGGEAELTVTQGHFDRLKCEAYVRTTATVKPRPILPGGLLYGFRACAPDSCARQSLVLVYPRASGAAANSLGADPREQMSVFSLLSIPMQHGGGGSMVASITGNDLAAWHKTVAGVDGPPITRQILVGVEVTQSVSDPEPIAIAYFDAAEDGGDGFADGRTHILERFSAILVELANQPRPESKP
jgi:hypothetical protein